MVPNQTNGKKLRSELWGGRWKLDGVMERNKYEDK